ncbi:hypothetical protein [Archangium lansingense]|uniref:Curli production assembly/transport component CsgG n=1 Tax=Archangium lansingense TaxID=2995310 RepID=A0ABT4AKC7_9BACT|nr:hypothetical protein [Archangium lansinium]MCY1082158.1 hypothetical protein [Archangium lansinium]
MRRALPPLRASAVLAVSLLPLCVFASPLRVQFLRGESTITDIPELSTQSLQERTLYGLTQALKAEQDKATLVPAGATEGADVVVGAKLDRNGAKFRLVYVLQTKQAPKLHNQLAYEFTTPKLSDKGVTVMAQEILAEAGKLEEARKAQAAQQPAPAVTSAPAPAVATAPAPKAGGFGSTANNAPAANTAPVAKAADEYAEYSTTDDAYPAAVDAPRGRQQPLIVVHSGMGGVWGYGTQSYGFGVVVEPKWNITDWLAVGTRVDVGLIFGGRIVPSGTTSIALGASVGTLIKAELLLGSSGVRPFVGFGGGTYVIAGQSVSAGNGGAGISQTGGQFYGIAPQLGIDFGGLRLGVTYNHILGADIVIEQNVSLGVQAERLPRNYVLLELTGRVLKFGGSEKRPSF